MSPLHPYFLAQLAEQDARRRQAAATSYRRIPRRHRLRRWASGWIDRVVPAPTQPAPRVTRARGLT